MNYNYFSPLEALKFEILRYESKFLHVIITFVGFKITFSNIRSHGAHLLISPQVFEAISGLGFKRVNCEDFEEKIKNEEGKIFSQFSPCSSCS